MCGIVGAAASFPMRDFLLKSLSKLQYRGYDSAGVAYFDEVAAIHAYRTVGSVEMLEGMLPSFSSRLAIGHTRWATNGLPSLKNAHPQTSLHGLVTIVHNGIIENEQTLRTFLEKRGYSFRSSTDTELIADFLEVSLSDGNMPEEALSSLFRFLEGSFALAILIKSFPGKLYFAKQSSPLVLGRGECGHLVASDPAALVGYADSFYDLEDGYYGYVSEEEAKLYLDGREIPPSFKERNLGKYEIDLRGYPHFMIKEIEEEPEVLMGLKDAIQAIPEDLVSLVREASSISLIGCGSSFHAALLAARAARRLGKRANAIPGSEFTIDPPPFEDGAIFFLLSQSGETVDILDVLPLLPKGRAIAVTNAPHSRLARESAHHLFLDVGAEVAVAATKTFLGEVALLNGLFLRASGKGGTEGIDETSRSLREVIARKHEIRSTASAIARAGHLYFIGRAEGNEAAMECALKVKEVACFRCESFPSGELKHGPIALIEKGTPLVAFSTGRGEAMVRLNAREAEARGASVLFLGSRKEDDFPIDPLPGVLEALPLVCYGQLLSYFLALELGKPCDRPRNLAKSVTVR